MGTIADYRQYKRLRLDFKVKGHSNYKLSFIDGWVKKYSNQSDERLVKSALKQSKFKSNYFKTPEIKDINEDSFLMKYIVGKSFSEFFNQASKNDLDLLIEKLDGYFSETIVGEVDIPISIFKNKLNELPNGNELLPILSNKESIKIKVGNCHGDMTLSNMIFANDFYLIDFLDSYIESPTMDLIKLRQDTHLYWSLNMVDTPKDLTKIKLGLKYIDNWITNSYDIEDYELLQVINLLRIYPYTNNNKIVSWIENNIAQLCEHL